MTTRYLAMANPAAPSGERVVVVRDGFSWVALAAPIPWLLWHRAWFAGLIVTVLTVCAVALGWQMNSLVIVYVGSLLLGLATALEGGNWVVGSWQARGYAPKAMVHAASRVEAEMRLVERGLPMERMAPPPLPGQATRMRMKSDNGDMIFSGDRP